MEVGSNNCAIVLQVVRGDQNGTQWLRIWLSDHVPGGDLAFQVDGVTNWRE
jgi:hypothetical protein